MTEGNKQAGGMGGGRRLAKGAAIAAATGIGLSLYSAWLARRVEAAVPPDGKFIEIGDARLHYVERGVQTGGPAIVMVHGLGGQLRNFTYALADELAGRYRLIIVDRPGSGYSRTLKGSAPSIPAQGALVAGLIEALGLEKPLLLGHSLGGAVALATAIHHPGAIGGLALVAPLAQPQQEVPEMFRLLAAVPAPLRVGFAQTLGTPLSRLASKKALEAIFAPEPVPDDFPVRGGGLLAQRPANIAAAQADIGHAGEDMDALAARYGQIAVPTGILFARRDHVLDAYVHGERTAKAVPGAELDLVEGGHMLPITQPQRTAAFVEKLIARMR